MHQARSRAPTRRSSRCKIDQGYEFTTDTIASILTSGLLGEVYIGLDAGGDPKMLADGGKITKTQSADRARKADRPVPVRQGRDGRRQSERIDAGSAAVRLAVARVQRSLLAALVAGCAAAPSQRRSVRADEPRALPGARRRRHGRRASRSRRPTSTSCPQLDPHGRVERLQQHRRPVLGGQRPAAGQARQGRQRPGPRACSTRGSASAASSTSRR